MKKLLHHSTLVVGIIALAVVLALPSVATARNVHAQEAPIKDDSSEIKPVGSAEPESESESNDASETEMEDHHMDRKQMAEMDRREEVKSKVAERREKTQTRLQDAKLRACQNREKAITNIMSRIADRGQKHLDLFTTIADRTEAFYEAKGKALATYDQLVADVAAKKTAAESAVATIKSSPSTFACDGDNPKGAITSFKTALKSEIAALRDYRTAVKNLIVGVKSVQSDAATETKGTE